MRCQHCKGSVSTYNFFKEKQCPACGKQLKKMPTKEQLREIAISFAEDKGHIFWALVYIVVIYVVSFFEQIFWKGILFDYVTDHWIRFYIIAGFSGNIIDCFAKANVEVTNVRNKYIFRPPLYLRRFRNYTNVAAVLGLALSAYIIYRWPNFIGILPTFSFITAFVLCFAWAILGLMLSDYDMDDKRIRYFMTEMRVERVRKLNRASAIYIGGIFVSGVIFYWLVNISGLWFYISNSRVVYNFTKFLSDYFGWVDTFVN
ncbi:MAG: hypothetical protein HQ568_04780 [Calditrichaeota bacterium]|nr:hypothetical protein [Calditrichota bacterium]